ncbi:hypothetical protein DEU52_10241 [Ensifer adhaerens]|nr:hypothetical protein DEU52_10241 [Ensifer adhaerens]
MDIQELQERVEALELAMKTVTQTVIGVDRTLSGALKDALRRAASELPDGVSKDTIERFRSLHE